MLGVYVTVPITCFRKGLAREYLETEALPPPATCYGFLLSLVGESNRERHIGCRVTPVMLNRPAQSVVLRTVWRVKKTPLGSPGNTRPDYQQLLTGVEAIIWVDCSEERHDRGATLESRVRQALSKPAKTERFGGLSLGESAHLVNEVCLLGDRVTSRLAQRTTASDVFLTHHRGRLTLPVWVDHVGSAGTRYETGNVEAWSPANEPPRDRMPVIQPLVT